MKINICKRNINAKLYFNTYYEYENLWYNISNLQFSIWFDSLEKWKLRFSIIYPINKKLNVNVQCLNLQRIDPFLINYNLPSYARDHSASFSTRYSCFLFLLFTLFQRFYHQMSQQESQCFHGGQVNLARLSFVQLTQKKRLYMINAKVNISFNLFFFFSLFFPQFYFHRMNCLLLIL